MMVKRWVFSLAFGLWIAALACTESPYRLEYTAVHMGTPVRIVVYGPDSSRARDAVQAAFARIADLDNIMSDYRPRSEVRLLTEQAGVWVAVSEDLFAVLARALEVAAVTDGAFDPTVGPLVALWRESRETGRLPDESALLVARSRVGWRLLSVDSSRRAVRLAVDSMKIDLGGIAKGYILQDALEVLRAKGHGIALIEAGGDVVAGDAPPGAAGWSIDVNGAGGELEARASHLTRAAIATSGNSEQFVEVGGVQYSHVVDPRTGLGLTHQVQVSVIANDGATADAVATAAGVLGPSNQGRLIELFPSVLIEFKR